MASWKFNVQMYFFRRDADQLPHFSNDTIAILIYDRPMQLISLFVFHKHDRAARVIMYIYYILRGTQAGNAIELEGDIDEEGFPGVDLGYDQVGYFPSSGGNRDWQSSPHATNASIQ